MLFVSYNRVLYALDPSVQDPTHIPDTNLWKVWAAGATGGIAIWVVSAHSEFEKCQAQLGGEGTSSWSVAKNVWQREGIRGLYRGGTVTSVRDSVGYGF